MDSLAIATQIKAEIEAAGGINVFDRIPRIENMQAIIDSLLTDNREFVHFWTIQRVASFPRTSETHPGSVPIGCLVYWMHDFQVILRVAYLQEYADRIDSLIYFHQIVDQVLTALAGKRTYGAWNSFAPLALVDIREGAIGGTVMTHDGMFGLSIMERQEVQAV